MPIDENIFKNPWINSIKLSADYNKDLANKMSDGGKQPILAKDFLDQMEKGVYPANIVPVSWEQMIEMKEKEMFNKTIDALGVPRDMFTEDKDTRTYATTSVAEAFTEEKLKEAIDKINAITEKRIPTFVDYAGSCDPRNFSRGKRGIAGSVGSLVANTDCVICGKPVGECGHTNPHYIEKQYDLIGATIKDSYGNVIGKIASIDTSSGEPEIIMDFKEMPKIRIIKK